ncbi:glycoside hydrolase family 97 N-terminal domain-containing protein [Bacteroides sp. CR5/BHMF/2]|nr:glycoside hydrolase family 97 N-terminal domain-containing protein [Bacteroides sp. CR5/BHMF/2]
MGWGQKVLQLQSPDKKQPCKYPLTKICSIGISQNGTVVLEPSVIGMDIREAGMLGEAPKLKKVERRSISGQKIVSPVYKKSTVDETYNELTANFKGNYSVIFRCYNQGVAYRFVTELTSGQVTVNDEKAIYKFPEQAKGYAAYSNRGKDGNIESQFLNSFENTYDCQPLPH